MLDQKIATSPIEADPAVIKFGYTNYKVDKSSETLSANRKKCKALIREKIGTTSKYIFHYTKSMS